MEKSFYYLVTWQEASILRAKLDFLELPYTVEQKDNQLAIVFPDLPIRQYSVVRQLFGGDGLPFRE